MKLPTYGGRIKISLSGPGKIDGSLRMVIPKTMSEIISKMMKEKNLKPDSFSKVVLYAPDQRTHRSLGSEFGI